MDLSEKILAARKQIGYTQEYLAESTNLSLSTIQRIENGKVSPRSHTLQLLSNILNVQLLPTYSSAEQQKLENESQQLFLLAFCTMLFAFLPFFNLIIPALIWYRTKNSKKIDRFGKRILLFQTLWFLSLLTGLFLIPIVSYAIAGQHAIGKFNTPLLMYVVFLMVNMVCTVRFYLKAQKT